MSPARRQLDIAAVAKPLEAGITVDLNDAFELRQMRGGTFGPAIGAVEIDRRRRIGPVPGPVIAGIDPEPAGLGAASAGIEHRDRGVVGEQLLRGEDMLGEPCLQRLQPPASSADPVGQRRAIELDALSGEDLALPVERKVIAVFGDQDMGEKTGSGEALGDRTLRGGRLVDGPAGPAAIARPADADDPKPRRHMVQHLADGLADGHEARRRSRGRLADRDRAAYLRGADAPAGFGRSVRDLDAGVLIFSGSVASTRAISALRSSKPSCN